MTLNKKNNREIISKEEMNRRISFSDSCRSWEKYYTNKIVVPIRVELEKLDDKYNGTDERNLYGFICLEFKKDKLIDIQNEFDKDGICFGDLLKTFADSMYSVYNKIYNKMSYSHPTIT